MKLTEKQYKSKLPVKEEEKVEEPKDIDRIISAISQLTEAMKYQRDDNKMNLLLQQSVAINKALSKEIPTPEIKVNIPEQSTDSGIKDLMNTHTKTIEKLISTIASRPVDFEVSIIRDEYGRTSKALLKGISK